MAPSSAADGVSRPEIRGPQLNGAGAFAAIRDSDNGAMDHDKAWDRAVGPDAVPARRPGAAVARDGDGDGTKNPHDIDDSALGSAVYLCGAGGSLANQAGMARAAFRYNHSDYYVQLVLSFQAGYQTGVFAVPSPPPPPARKTDPDDEAHGRREHAVHKPKKHVIRKPTRRSRRRRRADRPRPTPKPDAQAGTEADAEADAEAQPQSLAVSAQAGAGRRHLEGLRTASSASTAPRWTSAAPGVGHQGGRRLRRRRQRRAERSGVRGLIGQHVTLQGVQGQGPFVVYVIGGHGFRNADGSYARPKRHRRARALIRRTGAASPGVER